MQEDSILTKTEMRNNLTLSESTLYLLCLYFFKTAVGAILLVTGWDSLGVHGNELANITILMSLTFLPATFARPFFYHLGRFSVPKILTISLWISSVLIIAEHFLMSGNRFSLFSIHFVLWIFVFVIEIASEKWYVALSQEYNLTAARKLSGISTSVGQIGIITGPAIVMWSREYSQILPYFIILLSFFVSSAFAIKAQWKQSIDNPASTHVIQKRVDRNKRFLYILGFSLIWPTLTVFNLSIPVLAKAQFNSVDVAGFWEILIALAMVTAGFAHPYFTRASSFRQRTLFIFGLLIVSTFISYHLKMSFLGVSCGIFLFGLSFGYLRVELRAHLSKIFSPDTAGEIIASANSWSGLFVILYAVLFYFGSKAEFGKGLTLLFPLSFIICEALFIYILNFEENEEKVLLNAE